MEGEEPAFPKFAGHAVKLGDQPGMPYELDGMTLRALFVALNDFLPSGPTDQACWHRPESYRYRVIRQENITFIRIHADPASCEGKFLMLDSGVSYAISADGRILRRLFTGEPVWDSSTEVPDGGAGHDTPGEHKDAGELDLAPALGATWAEPRPYGGSLTPDGGIPGDDGGSPTPSR